MFIDFKFPFIKIKYHKRLIIYKSTLYKLENSNKIMMNDKMIRDIHMYVCMFKKILSLLYIFRDKNIDVFGFGSFLKRQNTSIIVR